ncbi:MAG: hypothetical protein IPM51_12295 [Sphingobacteriaceae bacterium]|nr:hypothetical protein [Sphingobacteriaceae bacterium]
MRSFQYLKLNKELLLIASFIPLLGLLYIFSDLMLPGHPFFLTKYMHLAYIKSAQDFPVLQPPPFTWRLLEPFLVNILPFQQKTSFILINFFSLFFTTVLILKIIHFISKDLDYSYLGSLLFLSIVWAARFNIIEFWYPESLLYFFMLLSIFFIYKQKKILLSISFLLGVLTKETMLIILPLYYFINIKEDLFKKINYRLLAENIIISLPAIITFSVLSFIISQTSFYSHSQEWFDKVFVHRLATLVGIKSSLQHNLIDNQPWVLTFAINWYRLVLGAFGGFFLIIFLRPKKFNEVFWAYSPLILFSYLQLFIAYDIERLIVISFFPIILATVQVIKELVSEGIKYIYFFIYVILFYFIQLLFANDFYLETFYAIFAQNILSITFLILIILISKRRRPITHKI